MTTITILPESDSADPTTYRAVAGDRESVGGTAGEALDALTPQLTQDETGTLIIVQHRRPDRFFTARQQQRLEELPQRWRIARDAGKELSPEEHIELENLVEAETRGAGRRAEAALQELDA